MKNLSIFIILFFTILFNVRAQNDICGTKPGDKPIIFSKEQLTKINSTLAVNVPYALKIWVTVFADDNGTNRATSDANIRRQIQNMTNQYISQNICFILMGITQVNNSDLNNHNVTNVAATDESNEILPFFITGYLNIFIHASLPGVNGVAFGIPASLFSLVGEVVNQPQTGNITTMGHEMGHCLGLYHTFEPWEDINGVPTNRENVARNGSCKNCTTAGDVLCDTPADDDGGVNGACNYIGGGMDACNTTFTPMTSNIMGYGNRVCRNAFTPEQGTRMRGFLLTNPTLNSYLATDIISRPVFPFYTENYTNGYDEFIARDYIEIGDGGPYTVSGSAFQNIISRKVTLKPGTWLHPSTGKVTIKSNPYCN